MRSELRINSSVSKGYKLKSISFERVKYLMLLKSYFQGRCLFLCRRKITYWYGKVSFLNYNKKCFLAEQLKLVTREFLLITGKDQKYKSVKKNA